MYEIFTSVDETNMAGAPSPDHNRLASLIEAGGWLAFVGLAFFYTFQFDGPLHVYKWGAAHWPRMVLLGMFIAACWLLYFDWLRSGMTLRDDNGEEDDETSGTLTISARVRMILIFTVPVIYTFLMHKMGFLLVTPFFLFFYMWLMGVQRLRTLIIVTIGIYTALVVVFVKLIFTYLPPGAGIFNAINGKILGLLT